LFAIIKQIFNPKNKDLQKRILFTLAVLAIFKLGTAIVVPGVNKAALGLNTLGVLDLWNVMGGGALANFSIFALSVTPYITASFIIQLLQMDIVPYLADLAKQGYTGRIQINKITRWLGIVMAFIQGYMLTIVIITNATIIERFQFALILTAATAFLLWLGDQITQKGFGNGLSMIIMSGIIAVMPSMFQTAFQSLSAEGTIGIIKFILFVVFYVALIVAVVYEQASERRIPIQYANKSASAYGNQQSYLPFKLNSSGVLPVIFASSLIAIPSFIAEFIKKPAFIDFVKKWIVYTSPTGFVLYMLLIIGFTYFYAYAQLKPKELAENLQKSGGFIPGIRPGEETEKYVRKVIGRITFVGALALAFIAALPIVFTAVSNLPSNVSIGGTGLLIVVGVALESYKQLESYIVSRSYKKGRR